MRGAGPTIFPGVREGEDTNKSKGFRAAEFFILGNTQTPEMASELIQPDPPRLEGEVWLQGEESRTS